MARCKLGLARCNFGHNYRYNSTALILFFLSLFFHYLFFVLLFFSLLLLYFTLFFIYLFFIYVFLEQCNLVINKKMKNQKRVYGNPRGILVSLDHL
jgi:hypothetical protein